MVYEAYIAVDNGLSGGITVIEGDKVSVYKMPVIKKIVNKKNKRTYDLDRIRDIFEPFYGKKVLFAIETISIRPGEGGVSSMTIGAGFGKLLGFSAAYRFKTVEISPRKWKKNFSQLESVNIIRLREEVKKLKLIAKTIKENKQKKENKKLIEKLNREIKADSKTGARMLASQLYPELSDLFVKKNSDGMGESLLIAVFAKDKQNELVQNSERF